MLLRGLTWLVLFQLLGTALNVLVLPILPGPIIGLLLLFVALLARGQAGESLQLAARSVMAYTEAILDDFWAIVGVLTVSLVVSLVFTGWLMQTLIGRQKRGAGRT